MSAEEGPTLVESKEEVVPSLAVTEKAEKPEKAEKTQGLEKPSLVNYKDLSTKALTEAWASEVTNDPKIRDRIMTALLERERTAATEEERKEAWPSSAIEEREEMAGLYPDPADPRFAARLYEKREFHDARAVAAGIADGSIDPCTSTAAETVFELTPVQRIVSRFLNPLTPYQGLLLFHGVGVGKTCSAVTIAEQFLESMPASKVIVLVPQALKENFKRTVFDASKLVWTPSASSSSQAVTGGEWSTRQCTGTSYLERLDLLHNPDLKTVMYKTEEDRRNRYTVTGYQAFANWVDRTLKKSVPAGLTDPVLRAAAENEVLRRLFSDHLIIVDEAHNLRDVGADAVSSSSASGEATVAGEAAENAGGKALNPFLKRIVLNAEGLRLVLMTATPMYNSAQEIVLLLNYLLMNDSKSEKSAMRSSDIFTKEGDIKSGNAKRQLEKAARRYVSYMRGENPYTFPLRMKPMAATTKPASKWPAVSATKNPVILTEQDTAALNALPLVFTEPVAGSPVELQLRAATSRGLALTASAAPALAVVEEEGEVPPEDENQENQENQESQEKQESQTDAMLDLRMQMANITYPNSLFGTSGFDFHFNQQTIPGAGHKLRVFKPKEFDVDTVFSEEGLKAHAPKIHKIVESIKSAKGICFAYSRYIKAGALPLAISLERAGYQRRLADGRLAPLLTGVSPVAPVCAVCGFSSNDGPTHPTDHPFKPACYVLLTSEEDISPNFAGLVRQATTWPDDPENGPLGTNVKVVIGSQVASEGLDLKCIREMHILDSWYHLNRTDQIIGRAIRYCSHTALRSVEKRQGLPPMALNNCLIYMHVTLVPATPGTTPGVVNPAFETADMYAYRIAIGKAQMVGQVQRLLKKHAWDCNLELEAITFTGLPPRKQIDAQGNDRKTISEEGEELGGYSINDQDYTTYCDYQVCRHQCAITINEADIQLDTSTFSVTDARRIILGKQEVVRHLFDTQVMIPETVVQDIFGDLPWEIASEALMELLDGRRFRLTRPDGVEGFLVKKAGFLVFQPEKVADSDIPMALRFSRAFQMRRHVMEPQMPVLGRGQQAEEKRSIPSLVASSSSSSSSAAAPSLVSNSASSSSSSSSSASSAAPSTLLSEWAEWLAFVNGGPVPAKLGSTKRIWSWILSQYATVPELKEIAYRWWFEKELSYEEQKAILEYAAKTAALEDPIQLATNGDIFRNPGLTGYRIFNPTTGEIDVYRWNKDGAIVLCNPDNDQFRPVIEKGLGNTAVPIPGGTGPLFGFLAAKKGKLVFKTLDTTKPKKHSSVGAECGNTSNLGEHHPRIRMLHEAGRASELASLMLNDSEASWDEAGAKARMAAMKPTHMKDITHQPLCLYMEVLTRLLDARHVSGKRWFFSGVDAFHSGLKGKI
jgi:hypothetical protein